jgi:hypothetical protein
MEVRLACSGKAKYGWKIVFFSGKEGIFRIISLGGKNKKPGRRQPLPLEVNKLCSAYPAGSARGKGFSLARFARGRRGRRAKEKSILGLYVRGVYLCGPCGLCERKLFSFFSSFFIRVNPRSSASQKVRRGTLLRALKEFGVKGDKALF